MAELDLTQMRNDIDVEVARAVGKDKAIEFELTNTTDKLNEEISDRKSEDKSLRAAIDRLLFGAIDSQSGIFETTEGLRVGETLTRTITFDEPFDVEPFAIAFRIPNEHGDIDLMNHVCGVDIKIGVATRYALTILITNTSEMAITTSVRIKWLAFTDDASSRSIEITDAKLGYDGILYDTIGNAIRRQIGNAFDLSSKMQSNMISFEEFYDIAIPINYGVVMYPPTGLKVPYSAGQYAVIQVKPGDVYRISADPHARGLKTYGALLNEENEFLSSFFFRDGDDEDSEPTMDGIFTIPNEPEGVSKMVLNGTNEKPISVQKLINNEKNIAFWEDIEDMHRRIEELERRITDLS